MTGRVLVWPWHGRLQNGAIQLANGTYRSHPQPANAEVALELFGPGDTHHIKVNGVEAISQAEEAIAPPGGQWWAGEALLSGTMLYGKKLDGWIYQGPEDSRWWVKIQNVTVGASSTTGAFRVRRFGRIGGQPEERLISFTLNAGRCSPFDAPRIGADLGGRDVGYLRLHAVSKTGRTAILALVTRNTGASFDRRPRAYRFYLASVSGQGEALSISVSQLFGIDEIAPQEAPQPNRGYVKLKSPEAKETSRTPFTRDGEVVADDVTYNLDGDAGFEVTTTQTPFTVPGTYTGERLIMLQVRLDGESPTPIYAKHATTCTVPWPSLQWVTTRERKVREWLHGGRDTLEEALIKLTGGVAVEAQVEFSVGDWTDQVTISAASAVDTEPYAYGTAMPLDAVTNTYSLSGVAGAIQHVVSDLSVQHLGPRLGGSFFWSGSARQPSFGASVGVVGSVQGTRSYLLSVDMLSNNLLAVSGRIDQGQQSYICAVAAGQVKPYSGPYPAAGLSAFGSYNPVTDAVAIASTPVNWI